MCFLPPDIVVDVKQKMNHQQSISLSKPCSVLLFCSELFTVKELQYGNTKFADNDHICNLKIQASRDLDFADLGLSYASLR